MIASIQSTQIAQEMLSAGLGYCPSFDAAQHARIGTIATFNLVHDPQQLETMKPEIVSLSEDKSGIKLNFIDNHRQLPARETGIGRRLFCCPYFLIKDSSKQPAMLVCVSNLRAGLHLWPLFSVSLKAMKICQFAPGSSTGRCPSALLFKNMRAPVAKLPSSDCAIYSMEAGLFDGFAVCPFGEGSIKPHNLPPQLSQEVFGGPHSKNLVQRKNCARHLDTSVGRYGNGATALAPVSMNGWVARAKHVSSGRSRPERTARIRAVQPAQAIGEIA